jgi:hypothetical protein
MNARRDPEDNRRRVKEWQQKNPEKKRAQDAISRERSRTDLIKWIAWNLRSTKGTCKRRAIEFSLTASQVQELYERQCGKCALTGRALIFGSKGVQRDSLSLDRIEVGGPYAIDNVRLVTMQANVARHRFDDEELFAFCEAVLATRMNRLG